MVLWPQLDALRGRVQDRLRVEAGMRLRDVCGGPFTDEGHRPSRRQRPDPVAPLPVPQAATQAACAQHQARRPRALGLVRPGTEVGGLPAVGELQADVRRFLGRHVPVGGWLGVVEPGADPELEPALNAHTPMTATATVSVRASTSGPPATAQGNSATGRSQGPPCGRCVSWHGTSSKNPTRRD
jgi:hypothetical protein